MEHKQKQGIAKSTVVIIAVFVFLAGALFGGSLDVFRIFVNNSIQQATINQVKGDQDFTLYWNVYSKLKDKYVDTSKIDKKNMYYGSIKGMVEAIGDPATMFLDPTETADYNKSRGGEYSGIGAELDYVNKQVIIVAPFDGSPAAQAGIEAGDIITKVDGNSVSNKTINEVVTMVRGTAETQVKLTVFRPRLNKPLDITITRGNISAPSMAVKEIKDGVANVKISRFTESTFGDWKSKWISIAQDLQSKVNTGEVKSIVLDLRGNPGGYFDAAVYLAGDFLPKGSVIAYQRGRDSQDDSFSTENEPRLANVPVVILVNGSSASASEIFAGAMQYYKRATIIGDKSYGKGTAQIIIPLYDGSSLHVTVTKWLLPDKRWISHENPITPDKLVPFDYDAKDKGVDNQMEYALEVLKTQTK